MAEMLFEVETPLGVVVTTTVEYWNYIVTVKHRIMAGKEQEVREVLRHPDEIRRSRNAPDIFLYYQRTDRLYCAVVKHSEDTGFLITAYPADKVKEGEIIWTK